MPTQLTKAQELGIFETSPLGLGTSRLGAFWQKRSPAQGLATLEAALDAGISLIDTADVYARGISERLVGKATRQRPEVTVMTKVGLLKTPRGILEARRHQKKLDLQGLAAASLPGTCFAPDYVQAAAYRCLKRQGRAELDILLLHEPQPADLARPELIERLNQLQQRGMIRAWGASVRNQEAALAASQAEGLSILQIPSPLGQQQIADSLLERREGISLIGLALLGDGTLLPRLTQAGLSPDQALAALVHGAYQHPALDAILLGMSRPGHVQANLAALSEPLDPQVLQTAQSLLEREEA